MAGQTTKPEVRVVAGGCPAALHTRAFFCNEVSAAGMRVCCS